MEQDQFPPNLHNDSVEQVLIYDLRQDPVFSFSGLMYLKDKNKKPTNVVEDSIRAQEIYGNLLSVYDKSTKIVKRESSIYCPSPSFLVFVPSNEDASKRLVLWVYSDFFRLALNPQPKLLPMWDRDFYLSEKQSAELLNLFSISKDELDLEKVVECKNLDD